MGGILLIGVMGVMAIWRGLQRYSWRQSHSGEVQSSYLLAGVAMLGLLFLHSTLGAHLGEQFGLHNTAVHLIHEGQDPNIALTD
jgi:uncharacterized membrane protein